MCCFGGRASSKARINRIEEAHPLVGAGEPAMAGVREIADRKAEW